jgi:hypothetical protein
MLAAGQHGNRVVRPWPHRLTLVAKARDGSRPNLNVRMATSRNKAPAPPTLRCAHRQQASAVIHGNPSGSIATAPRRSPGTPRAHRTHLLGVKRATGQRRATQQQHARHELDPAQSVHAAGDNRVVPPVRVPVGQRPQIPAHRLESRQPTSNPAAQLCFVATYRHAGQ